LQLPIHVITLAVTPDAEQGERQAKRIFSTAPPGENAIQQQGILTPEMKDKLVQACAEACARVKVPWKLCREPCHTAFQARQFVEPADLFVFSRVLPSAHKKDLLRQMIQEPKPAVLVCPATYSPLSRLLLLYQGRHLDEPFLAGAGELCRRFQITPVVLTVARSERKARLLQLSARKVLADYSLSGDFDFVVGSEIRSAVASVARWRRCQLVVLGPDDTTPWWRWLRGSTIDQLLGLPDPLAFLTLPAVGAFEFPPEPTCTSPPFAEVFRR
jgi:hypothetical protein